VGVLSGESLLIILKELFIEDKKWIDRLKRRLAPEPIKED